MFLWSASQKQNKRTRKEMLKCIYISFKISSVSKENQDKEPFIFKHEMDTVNGFLPGDLRPWPGCYAAVEVHILESGDEMLQ